MAAWVADLRNIGYKFPAPIDHFQKASDGQKSLGLFAVTTETKKMQPVSHTPIQWRRYYE